MSKMNENALNSEKVENLDDAHAVIGQIASLLFKTGRPLEVDSLTTLLKQRADQTVSSRLKKEYDAALALIAEKTES
ncbi:hypothetical protein [Pantoea sp. KPR_PJ]|uniref:hypothetical protein n=1 Tax=Pantoea sp. KPR_PJ TaxID=2738375 RepID=UPI0035289385